MKNIAILLCLAFLFCSKANAQTINPSFSRADIPNLSILRIDVKPSETVIKFKYIAPSTYEKGGWVNLSKDIFIRDCATQKRYAFTGATNIPLAPNRHNFNRAGEILEFTLKFAPLPTIAREIDIVENEHDRAFNIYNVKLHHNISSSQPIIQKNRTTVSTVQDQPRNNESYTIDTLYYDKDWKGAQNKAFASYYRVILIPKDMNYNKKFRDYFITGELQAEGGFVSIDKYDDSKSVFDGESINYSIAGNILEKRFFKNGVIDGDYYVYHETNGLVHKHVKFYNGKMNGIYTEFSEDGATCYQLEYVNGNPKSFYIISSPDGYSAKFNLSDNSPLWEQPSINERKTEYRNGEAWPYYIKNGLSIAMTNTTVKDYGKYFRISLVISNNSIVPFEFIPEDIIAILTDNKGNEIEMAVLSSNDYMKKVRRNQNWAMALNGLAEGMAAANAGYSTSTTNSYKNYGGISNSYGSVSAYGNGGYATGSYSGITNYSGYSNTSSRTVSYDGAAAYQAQVIASQRAAQYDYSLLQDRAIKEEGYLKRTTLYPGDVISGYVHIERRSGQQLNVVVKINGINYIFPWNVQ